MKRKLRKKFAGEPPDTRVHIFIFSSVHWEVKLFETGSILDKPIQGRLNDQGDHYEDIDKVTLVSLNKVIYF